MAILNYDARGFIIGLNRIEQQTSNVHDDTQEIIRILKGQRQISDTRLQSLQDTLSQINSGIGAMNQRDAMLRRASNPRQGNASSPTQTAPGRASNRVQSQGQSGNASNGSEPRQGRQGGGTNRIYGSVNTQEPGDDQGANGNRGRGGRIHPPVETQDNNHGGRRDGAGRPGGGNPDRGRDSRGRFTAAAEDSSFINRLGSKIGSSFRDSTVDGNNIDPLIDSFNEAKTIFSPVTGMFGLITGGRDKPSRYERRRDRDITDTLDDIAENTNSNRGGNNGGRGGLLGGLMGRLGGTAIGGLLGGALAAGAKGVGGLIKNTIKSPLGKRIPYLASALDGYDIFSEWNKDGTQGNSGRIGKFTGGLSGTMAGMTAGAAVGSVVPVIGTAVGAAVGGIAGYWFGSNAGQALGEASAPYINRWTGNLDRANLPNKMLDIFTKGLTPLFAGGKSIWDWVKEKLGFKTDSPQQPAQQSGFWSSMWGGVKQRFGFGGGGAGSDTSGGDFSVGDVGGSNPNYAGSNYKKGGNYRGDNIGGKPNNVAVYDGYRKAGLTHSQALALTAEVGREGGFANKNIFGYHTDAARDGKGRKITNVGMLSWNRERGAALSNYLTQRGLMKNGKMVQSQEAIDAMAQFSVNEMRTTYRGKLNHFWNNPNANPETYAKEVGRKYVGWAYGQNELRGGAAFDWKSHDNRRRGYLMTTASMIGEEKPTVSPTPTSAPSTTPAKATAKAPIPVPRQTKEQAKMTPKQVAEERTKRLTQPPTLLKPQVKAATTPAVPRLSIPTMPVIPQKLSSDTPKVIVASNSQDLIPQNVSDRGLAHAITGGLGEDRYLIG